MTPYPLGFRTHLALIAVVALLLGASLYARAHATDCKTVGELRSLLAGNRGGSLRDAQNKMNPIHSGEVSALLAVIPANTPVRATRAGYYQSGNQVAHVSGSGARRSSYFSLSLGESGGSACVGGDFYAFDYDSAVGARLKAAVARLMTPAAK